jgi:hypothetical protein
LFDTLFPIINVNGMRAPNLVWRPFVVTLSKSAIRQGQQAHIKNYYLAEISLKEIFAILSGFYNFLIQAEATEINPVAHIRQKSKFLGKRQSKHEIRRFSEFQREYVEEKALRHQHKFYLHLADKCVLCCYMKNGSLLNNGLWILKYNFPKWRCYHRCVN